MGLQYTVNSKGKQNLFKTILLVWAECSVNCMLSEWGKLKFLRSRKEKQRNIFAKIKSYLDFRQKPYRPPQSRETIPVQFTVVCSFVIFLAKVKTYFAKNQSESFLFTTLMHNAERPMNIPLRSQSKNSPVSTV